MANVLEVKNLKISFRTNGGTVKAVRNISFNLERGETLAIVGESGSGKSVTSKAILGILAGNSIVESGEILYDGRDLLHISEEEMCKIRGDKVAMIFQDPLSSLDPIVKIGKQITEAMLLKNKTNRRRARVEFNSMLEKLKENMLEVSAATGAIDALRVPDNIKTFDEFNIKAITIENNYNTVRTHAEGLSLDIADFLFRQEKKQKLEVKKTLAEFVRLLKTLKDPFLTVNYDEKLTSLTETLATCVREYKVEKDAEGKPVYYLIPERMKAALAETKETLDGMLGEVRPNFFRIGYYMLKNPEQTLDTTDISALNAMALDYLDRDFMGEFLKHVALAMRNSFNKSFGAKKAVLEALREARGYFEGGITDKKTAYAYAENLRVAIEPSIDPLQYVKDSVAYTFAGGLKALLDKYFLYEKQNPKEEARYERQNAKREALIAKGKTVEWKVVPKNVYDLDVLRLDILSLFDRLAEKYEGDIENLSSVDFDKSAVGLIDYLKERASEVVYKITKRMARDKAIKLMEEVGIPEPRIRYYQYPFEFSGGMRQRIVIAIALAANPDILICDEPTTALDVTIQAQILELINKLKKERNLSVIFITHDLGVVANMADRIAVMYAGKIVEYGTANEVFYNPQHPYTWALLSSMPDLDTNEKLDAIPGTPPNMIYPPAGDAFAARNKYALKIDFEEEPPMFEVSPTHKAATWLLHPDAPKVEMPKIITERIARMKKAGGRTDD